MGAGSVPGGLICDDALHLMDIAKEIYKTSNKVQRKFGCPIPTSVTCGGDQSHTGQKRNPNDPNSPDAMPSAMKHCTFEVASNAVIPPRCMWSRHVEEASFKTFRKQKKAALKYGCDATSKIACAPIQHVDGTSGTWWHCGRDATIDDQGNAPDGDIDPSKTGSQNLKKKVCVLPLKEIAEEVASVLEYECPHVTSLVCPSLNLHDAKRAEKISLCQLGVPADERKLACSRAVQQRATRKVMHELMGAKRSLPSLCQGEMKQVLCTRSNDARRWMSCMFLSGGHGAELPVGQVPVHDSL